MDYEMIVNFFKNYGWQLTLLAMSGIVFLGALKWFGCFKKLKSSAKKYVYFGLSCGLSILACLIYLLCTHGFNWFGFLILCVAVIGLTSAVYTVYENIGLRAFVTKFILNPIATLVKKIASAIASGSITPEKAKGIALKLGSETLLGLANEAKSAEEKIAQESTKEPIAATVETKEVVSPIEIIEC